MRISTQVVPAIILLLTTFFYAQAQRGNDHVQRADRYYERKDYGNALIHYRKALAVDAENAQINYRAGVACLHQEEYSQAVGYLEKAYALNADVDADIDYYLGTAYQHNHQFSKALARFEAVRKVNKRLSVVASQKIRQCIDGDSLMKIAVNGEVEVLSSHINSPFSDFAALFTADENTLVFTSSRSGDDYHIKSGGNDENVYISRKASGAWSSPVLIGDAINVKFNEAATFISADGTMLLLYYEDGGGDIYTSRLVDEVWSRPEPLNRFVNHPQYRESSASLSPDGKRLFFSSDRPGGRGGFDLYVSTLGANGQWGRPTNLGPSVNTRGDEQWPFVHADSVTLYFTSNGWATLGETDIFKTVEQDGKWSQPQNLGYPINTSAHEGHFAISSDNRTGYFTSLRNGKQGGSDIFTVQFSLSQSSRDEFMADDKKEGRHVQSPD